MCEAELWDEALVEIHSLHEHGLLPLEAVVAYKASVLLKSGRTGEVIRLAEQIPACAYRADPYLAMAYAKLGDYDQASEIAQAVLDRDRRMGAFAIGGVLYEKGAYEEALAWYERADRIGDNGQTHRMMGKLLFAIGDMKEARACTIRAIRDAPYVHLEDLTRMAEICRGLSNPCEAGEWENLARTSEQESSGSLLKTA